MIAVLGIAVLPLAGAITAMPAGATTGLSVTDLDNGTTVSDLANDLGGSGVSVSNVTYTGENRAAGTFTGGTGIIGFDSGIVLSTGKAQTYPADSACGQGVEGPNTCYEATGANPAGPAGGSNSTAWGQPGDTDLTTLSGVSTNDAAVLQFDFVPKFSTVQFKYVFSSEEYSDFSNTGFNDVFGFFVNGTNCALVPGTSDPVSVNTINDGNDQPASDTTPHNAQYFINNVQPTLNTQMDGLTTVLTCDATVTANQTNSMKLAIADGTDDQLDSGVFLQAQSLSSGTTISTSLSGGGNSGTSISVPPSTAVTDTATLGGPNAATAGGTVTYNVYSDVNCAMSAGSGGTKSVSSGTALASDSVALSTAGTYYWQAVYSGDAASNNNGVTSACGSEIETVTGGPPATTLTVSPGTGDFADATTVSATLTNTGSAAGVSGKSVTFKLNGTETCTGTTNASGVVTCSITPGEAASAAPYTLGAAFAGDASFAATSGSANFTVTHEETALSYTGATSAINGQPATLSGTLTTDDPAGAPLAGKLVTFTLGSGGSAQTCTGTTNASGAASCTIPSVSQSVGPVNVADSFAGDTFYQPANGSSSVSVFAPTVLGAFVIGDRSAGHPTAGTAVNFWGAQWAKSNQFSGGSAPSSMKGYANDPASLTCGSTWTTTTGNSSNPPATLPGQIEVIVASKVTQKGSTISGSILHIVWVKVGPGYKNDPGHAGNGSIVSVVC